MTDSLSRASQPDPLFDDWIMADTTQTFAEWVAARTASAGATGRGNMEHATVYGGVLYDLSGRYGGMLPGSVTYTEPR